MYTQNCRVSCRVFDSISGHALFGSEDENNRGTRELFVIDKV
jgi:hypothetical protein